MAAGNAALIVNYWRRHSWIVLYYDIHFCCVTTGTSVSFIDYCSFSSVDICGMNYCKKGLAEGWKRMSVAAGGPLTDHTNLNKMGGKAWFYTVIQLPKVCPKIQDKSNSCFIKLLTSSALSRLLHACWHSVRWRGWLSLAGDQADEPN